MLVGIIIGYILVCIIAIILFYIINNKFIKILLLFIIFTISILSWYMIGGFQPKQYNPILKSLNVSVSKSGHPCFYVDTFENASDYYLSNIEVSTELNQSTLTNYPDNVFWQFSKIKNSNVDLISLVDFDDIQHCIEYGQNINSYKSIFEIKKLHLNQKYKISIRTGIKTFWGNEDEADEQELIFSKSFTLHKNSSTGKIEVEIVNN